MTATDSTEDTDSTEELSESDSESDDTATDSTEDTDSTEELSESDSEDEAPEFPRSYVTKLRADTARYRKRGIRFEREAAQLRHALFTERVASSGRFADPTDASFDDAALESPQAMTAHLDAILAAKPHLASRKAGGDIGQGEADDHGDDSGGLGALLRAGA